MICPGDIVKGKADDLYRGSMQFVNHFITALQYPLVHWTLCRFQLYTNNCPCFITTSSMSIRSIHNLVVPLDTVIEKYINIVQ